MRSPTRRLLVVAVIGCGVDEPLFYSAILISFVYAMMLLIYLHAQNSQIRGGRYLGRGVIVQISCFCKAL